MSRFFKITAWLSLAATTVILAYDVWVVVQHGTEASISNVHRTFSYDWTTIPLFWGVIIGHLFWYGPKEIVLKKQRIGALWVLTALSLAADVADLYDINPLFVIIPGIAVGRFLWPQPRPDKMPVISRWNG